MKQNRITISVHDFDPKEIGLTRGPAGGCWLTLGDVTFFAHGDDPQVFAKVGEKIAREAGKLIAAERGQEIADGYPAA